MSKIKNILTASLLGLAVFTGCSTPKEENRTVNFMMWQGDPYINDYITNYIVPEVKAQLNIDLNVISGQGNEIVGTLMREKEAGKQSEIDMCWINGETFYQLRQIDALYGPFVDSLPNAQYINFDSKFIKYDFQQEVNGYECPWGNVQLALIYDTTKVVTPPKNPAELAQFVKANPGKFTLDVQFTGMTFLKSLLVALSPDIDLNGEFNQAKYDTASARLWAYINRLKPYFWKEGKTFPENPAKMHQLLSNGEIWFSMSNNDGEVDNKILQGTLPTTCKAYVLESGTIQNSHYLGIVNHSDKQELAMQVINFMISPEAQYKKAQPSVWGDGTILAIDKLPAEWQQKFNNIPGRVHAPPRNEIQPYAIMELAPDYMINIYADFRKQVIEK